MRPMLRPGTHVLQRGSGELQVGLDPASALVLPDASAVRDSLRLLGAPGDVWCADAADVATLELLAGHDQVLDQRDLVPLLADEVLDPPATAALARAVGPDAPRVRSTRRRWRSQTRTFGHPAAAGLRNQFVALVGSAGLQERAPRSLRPPDAGVLVGVGEPHREMIDDWTRDGTPYLLVRMAEGRAVVGPFVVPGQTACLHCVDAHCTDADASWPLLVRQYAAASSRDRPDGAPEPVDPLLSTLALAWAARDLASFVDGQRPSTWSATVTIDPGLTRLETRSWLRHPACSCTWD